MRKVTNSITVRNSIRELKNTGLYGDILCSMKYAISNSRLTLVDTIMDFVNHTLENNELVRLTSYLYYNEGNVCRGSRILKLLNKLLLGDTKIFCNH